MGEAELRGVVQTARVFVLTPLSDMQGRLEPMVQLQRETYLQLLLAGCSVYAPLLVPALWDDAVSPGQRGRSDTSFMRMWATCVVHLLPGSPRAMVLEELARQLGLTIFHDVDACIRAYSVK